MIMHVTYTIDSIEVPLLPRASGEVVSRHRLGHGDPGIFPHTVLGRMERGLGQVE